MADVVISGESRAPDPGSPRAGDVGGSRPDDTTARLLTAAAEVFAEKGYDGAGVAEIARRAGLTTGAIYSRYFCGALESQIGREVEKVHDRPPQCIELPCVSLRP